MRYSLLSMPTHAPLSSPGVRFPPPFLFVGGLLAGWLLDRRVLPIHLAQSAGSVVSVVSVVMVVVGLALMGWGFFTFRRAGTAIRPFHSASSLVTTGPYRFTRNPMYTGLTIAYVGGALLIDSAWPLILLPAVLVVLFITVIAREERYLSDAFSSEYAAYCARVRRWL
jgi:protein-S-isoprenylcysteine O-methyltransferase Ste14